MKRILLIDGSNLYESAKSLGFSIDFKRLLDLFSDECDLFRAYYFTALPDKSVQTHLRVQVDWMAYNGYIVVEKELKEYKDGDRTKLKGNMDMEMAMYALDCAALVDELVLFTGDGDFRILVERLQLQFKIKVTVVSSMKLASNDIRKQADEFIDLSKLQEHLEMKR